jgi:YegS/Rv2252/BmrU family lipid kinase
MKTMFLVNPRSGRGAAGARWPLIREIFQAENRTFDVAFTQSRGHGAALARAALQDGFELMVAVGGDGTVHEVINGMMADGRAVHPQASLGIIPCGTGNDLARMLELPRKSLAAARHLARSSQSRLIDVGEVLSTVDGKSEHRYFANDANMGFAAKVVERTVRTGKFSRGTLPYFAALLWTAIRHRNHEMTLQIDGRQFEGKLTTVLICNGRSTGGGMLVAPDAVLDDGQLDVIVVGSLSPLGIFWHAPKIYRGTHVAIRKVSVHRARTISVTSPERLSVVVDGELFGESPATFRVVPAALRLRV